MSDHVHKPVTVSLATRFWMKVAPPISTDECWEWAAGHDSDGYGRCWDPSLRNNMPAHRRAYELVRGPIPAGLTIDHLCRNRGCVNPWHMEPVTSVENVMRGMAPTAIAARRETCPKGHAYDGLRNSRGSRRCHECQKAASRRAYHRDPEKGRQRARDYRERVRRSA